MKLSLACVVLGSLVASCLAQQVPFAARQPEPNPNYTKRYELAYVPTCCPVHWDISAVKVKAATDSSQGYGRKLRSDAKLIRSRNKTTGSISPSSVDKWSEQVGTTWTEVNGAAQVQVIAVEVKCPLGKASKVRARHLWTLNHYKRLSSAPLLIRCGIEGDHVYNLEDRSEVWRLD